MTLKKIKNIAWEFFKGETSNTKHIGVDRNKAKPHISSKSISEIMDEVSRRHRKSLDKLAE